MSANGGEGGGSDTVAALVAEVPVGAVLGGRFKLVERTLAHATLGLTFNALDAEGNGYIVRVDAERNPLSLVRAEAGFLQAVSARARSPLGIRVMRAAKRRARSVLRESAVARFVEIVHGAKSARIVYFVTRHRAGPSLNACLGAAADGRFSVGTAARVAYHILKAIGCVHTLKYILRRVDPNAIHFDVQTRAIFLSDSSSVRLDPRHLRIDASVRWAGAQLYAPIVHHKGGSMVASHDVEALIFFLVDMTTARLPWEGVPVDMIGSSKRRAVVDQTLFNDCPSEYASIYTDVSCLSAGEPIDYKKAYKKLESAWRQAGVKDAAAESYDWEAKMLH